MANSKHVTFEQLCRLLLRLGFVDQSVKGSHRAFRHTDSNTLILLAEYYSPRTPLRDEDLASVRRHLDEKGLVDVRAFSRLFSTEKQSGIHVKDRSSSK